MAKTDTRREPDQYDRAVQYLTEHPEEIQAAWNIEVDDGPPYPGGTHPAACLFMYTDVRIEPSAQFHNCGCLTQIKVGHSIGPTPDLVARIQADHRLPSDVHDIEVEHLQVFAEWQREIAEVRAEYLSESMG